MGRRRRAHLRRLRPRPGRPARQGPRPLRHRGGCPEGLRPGTALRPAGGRHRPRRSQAGRGHRHHHQPPSHPPAGPPTPEEAAADRRRQYAYDEGVTALHAAQRKLADAVDHRDRAEGRAAGAIRETIDNDGLKDSWWDKFKNWVHEHADLLKAIAKIAELVATILSIIALAISWIPVLDFLSPILLGLAALASGVALVCNLALALAGDGSWLDVAADLFAVVTFGFGAYAASEARAARIAAEEEEVAAQEAAEEAARLRRLGEDPATGTFRQSEMETAQRVEGARGVKLERSTDPKVDWVGSDGKTYDAVGNFPAKYFNKQWPNLQTRILDHLQKADYVPIDISQFTPAQIEQVKQFIGPLGPRVLLVGE